MLKFIKGLLISALTMIIVGIIGVAIFLSVGGLRQLTGEIAGGFIKLRDSAVSAWRTIPGVERLDSIEGINISFEGNVLDVNINDAYETYEGDFTDDAVASASEITDIDISAMGSRFEIRESDTNQYQIESDACEKFQYFVEGGKLSLHVLPKLSYQNGLPESKMILYVPAEAELQSVSCILGAGDAEIDIPLEAQSIRLNVGAGNLELKETIAAPTVTIIIGAGEVTAKQITSTTLDVDLGAGGFTVSNAETTDAMLRVGMGCVIYDGCVSNYLQLDCGMGTMTITLLNEKEDYNYKIAGAAGAVQIEQDAFAGLAMEREIDNQADSNVDINCAMGNILIDFREIEVTEETEP